jgi:hypothetical protein
LLQLILIAVLKATDLIASLGCVHVGLRPSNEAKHHLFAKAAVEDLVSQISKIPHVHKADLDPFRHWLGKQKSYHYFNIGCMFAIDAASRLRICLHPKQVMARNEHSTLPEDMMREAELLSLVTLVPDNRRFLTVTIQPLICADALNLQTEHGNPPPIALVSSGHSSLANPPDHVDIISLATCTPQVNPRHGAPPTAWEWHQDFRTTFTRTQEGDWPRHRYATFAISNFEQINKRRGGLSGLFQPIALKDSELHDGMSLSCYGAPVKGENNTWSIPGMFGGWHWRGYLGTLVPTGANEQAVVRILAFKLASSLRDTPPWKGPQGPGALQVKVGRWDDQSELKFVDWNERHDG